MPSNRVYNCGLEEWVQAPRGACGNEAEEKMSPPRIAMQELKIFQKTEALYEGRWWEPMSESRVHCYLCPRHCHIGEGQSGLCFIRVNQGGKLYSLGYASPAALQIDPIEKKPLNHFLPGTRVFSLGTAG